MSSFCAEPSKKEKLSRASKEDFASSLKEVFPEIIFHDEKMYELLLSVQKIAPSSSPVLIEGETGTGKELIARAIHTHSGRCHKKMIPINCSAIPENILEAELFGYEKGAFTGADSKKPGILESLEGGTLFLDEIADMPLSLQVKLLRVLQEKKYMPLGSRVEKEVDIRFVAATNKPLEEEVKEGRFRSDLFYRLNVFPLCIPSLRERKKDIPCLTEFFLSLFQEKNQVKLELDERVKECFSKYSWPGNVRELCNLVERISLLKGEGLITAEDLPKEIKLEVEKNKRQKISSSEKYNSCGSFPSIPQEGLNLDAHLEEISQFYMKEALKITANNKKEAAKLLGLNRTTLVERIKKKIEQGKW